MMTATQMVEGAMPMAHTPVVYSTQTKTGLNEVGGTWAVILLVLIAIALYWGFSNHQTKEDERRLANQLFSLSNQVGINTKGVADLEAFSGRTDNRVDAITARYGFDIGRIDEQAACNQYRSRANSAKIDRLAFGGSRSCGSGCGDIPQFTKRAKYTQVDPVEIIERNTCGDACGA